MTCAVAESVRFPKPRGTTPRNSHEFRYIQRDTALVAVAAMEVHADCLGLPAPVIRNGALGAHFLLLHTNLQPNLVFTQSLFRPFDVSGDSRRTLDMVKVILRWELGNQQIDRHFMISKRLQIAISILVCTVACIASFNFGMGKGREMEIGRLTRLLPTTLQMLLIDRINQEKDPQKVIADLKVFFSSSANIRDLELRLTETWTPDKPIQNR